MMKNKMLNYLSFVLCAMVWPCISAETTSTHDHRANPDNHEVRLTEQQRVEQYHRRGYKWPIEDFVPNTTGWKDLMESRFRQVEEIENSGKRYEGFIQTTHSAFLVPNFTEHGFGLARCPQELTEALRKGIRDGLPTARHENKLECIDGPQALFIDRPDLTNRVLSELQNYAEEWSDMELTPYRAYGFRLYQNESQLKMHVDKVQTHIISFILHIDSSDDAEPWPIFIEDFHGRTHEVILTPGDILFYESSKLFHGRPRPLNGSWYSSIFAHYYPKHDWYERNHLLESHYAIHPGWSKEPPAERKHRKLEMHGTSMDEPECPNNWCRSMESVKWSGPGEEGFWIAPTFEKYPFNPKHEPKTEDRRELSDDKTKKTSVNFMVSNALAKEVTLYWKDSVFRKIKPGEKMRVNSFESHVFRASLGSIDEAFDKYMVESEKLRDWEIKERKEADGEYELRDEL